MSLYPEKKKITDKDRNVKKVSTYNKTAKALSHKRDCSGVSGAIWKLSTFVSRTERERIKTIYKGVDHSPFNMKGYFR